MRRTWVMAAGIVAVLVAGTGVSVSVSAQDDDATKMGEKETTGEMTGTTQASGTEEYVVQRGDTLRKIAKEKLGDASEWQRIAEMNDIENPNSLPVGKRLQIPERSEQAKSKNEQDQSERESPTQERKETEF